MIRTYTTDTGRLRASFDFDFDLDDVCRFAVGRALDPDGGPPFHTAEGWIAGLTRDRLAYGLGLTIKELGAVSIDIWDVQGNDQQYKYHAEGHWISDKPKPGPEVTR